MTEIYHSGKRETIPLGAFADPTSPIRRLMKNQVTDRHRFGV
jgi:hypothetical protein